MRKYLILIILLSCLHVATRGQTVPEVDLTGLPQPTQANALRYWFDDDGGGVKAINQLSGNQTFDVSALLDGLHTIHCQLIDSKDIAGAISSCVFIKMGAVEGSSASSMRCWFDDDANSVKTVSSTSGIYTLDVSTLTEGLHTVHYQVIGSDGKANFIASSIFMKMKSSEGALAASKLYYWYDDETAIKQVNVSQSVQTLDASMLNAGLHTLHYQVLCSNGDLTPVISSIFMRVNFDSSTTTAKSLRYWFDDEKTAMEAAITDGVQLLDASKMREGLHTVHYQIVDSKGNLGAPVSSIFMKMDNQSSLEAKSIRYWFDDNHASLKVTNVANGTQNIDVTDLLTGLHTLHYQLVDDQGNVGTPVSRIFMKDFDKVVPDGQNRITQYQYWINDKSNAMNTVDLSNASTPYQLISLIPVQKEPINSQLFHFEITDGQPAVYAKNVFHIRFHDAKGYFADEHHAFIDYSVKQEVTDAELLESGTPVTIAKPTGNKIKWYKVKAQKGDSLSFRTYQACTLQLFSPSGVELYSASSPEVLNFDGSYAPEDGIYYVAVHNAKSQSYNNLTVEYQHIDKYAVLDYTPNETGVAISYIYMKLNGNGYDKLLRASLMNSKAEIEANDIVVSSKSSVILQFPLNGDETIDVYDLVLHFKDEEETESLIVREAIRFIDANIGDITIKVEPSRRAGFPYPVIVTVKNTGNVTKLFVPLNLAASFNLTGKKPFGDLSGCSWTSMYTMNFDVLSVSGDEGDEYAEYSPYTLTDNLIDTGLPGVVLHGFIPELGPNESKEYILGFVGGAHQMFNLYAWTGKPLNETTDVSTFNTNIYSVWDYLFEIENFRNNQQIVRSKSRAPGDPPSALSVTGQVAGNAARAGRLSLGIGLAAGGVENGLRLRSIHAYTDNDPFAADVLADYEASVRSRMPTPGNIAGAAGIPGFVQRLLGLQGTQSQCGTPTGGAASIDIYAPNDPNDIIGYTSESGSKSICESITDVYYTIEFENDPEIANASAHTIVVRDTLDTTQFDLSTFAAKSVKLGDKVMQLNGEKIISKRTMDLRPEINVVAQVSLSLDEEKGIAEWTIESLDPITMDPTEDVMQGVLPVDMNGSGQGELSFDIQLKPSLAHGTEVRNRAGIVFDQEKVIMTPYWTNVIDKVPPQGQVIDVEQIDNETASVSIKATDELSGCYRYDVYVQYGQGSAWFKAAENVPIDTTASVKIYDGIDHGFYVVVTDSAGNVEQKEAAREFTLIVGDAQVTLGDANNDGKVDAADIVAVISYIEDNSVKDFVFEKADYNGDGKITIADAEGIANKILSKYQNSSPPQSRGPE